MNMIKLHLLNKIRFSWLKEKNMTGTNFLEI